MTQKEQARLSAYGGLNQLLLEQMVAKEAAQVLGLSERHLWRLLAAYRQEGAARLRRAGGANR